ncbi:MAG TPA: PilT/PilU family type 4a pilus ATPase [Acidimicrobiales bacterium]
MAERTEMTPLDELLRHLAEVRGSDLHLKPGAAPHVRVDGQLRPTSFDAPAPGLVEALAAEILDDRRRAELAELGEAASAVSVPGIGRFRVAVHRQRGSLAMVIRRVPLEIPDLAALGLPAPVERLAEEERGLLLVTGSRGAGKTTTVAALLDRINHRRSCHILTIEDPIEVIHPDAEAIVTQREVGTDTASYVAALHSGLRQDADVVFVGELVDGPTARAALTAAELGHLVISTMRASSAAHSVQRLIELFPPIDQGQVRHALGSTLRGIVNQRLLERADGRGRIPAVEVLVGTSKVAEAVADPAHQTPLDQLIAEGQYHGMQTLDQALLELVRDGMVSLRDALAASPNPEDLRIALGSAGVSSTI